jgi:AcrR family transcriptional regulator
MKVDIIEVESKQYKRAVDDEGRQYWDVMSVAKNLGVSYKTVYYHINTKKDIFADLTRLIYVDQFSLIENDPIKPSQRRKTLFIRVPDGLIRLKLYIRKWKVYPELNRLIESLSQTALVRLEQRPVVELLDQLKESLTGIIADVNVLKGERKFTRQHVTVVRNLINRYAEFNHLEPRQVWFAFRDAFGISGYASAERKYFVPFLKYFKALDSKVVASVFFEYKSKVDQDPEILKAFLEVLDEEQQQYLLASEHYMVGLYPLALNRLSWHSFLPHILSANDFSIEFNLPLILEVIPIIAFDVLGALIIVLIFWRLMREKKGSDSL